MANSELIAKLFDLSGKVAVVTGGNRGIGRGIALALAGAGAAVAITGRDPGRAERAAAGMAGELGQAIGLAMDVREEASVRSGIATVTAAAGALDGLVCNAGFGIFPDPRPAPRGLAVRHRCVPHRAGGHPHRLQRRDGLGP